MLPKDTPKWQRISRVSNSHHGWESATVVAASEDGRLLVACTGRSQIAAGHPPSFGLFVMPEDGEINHQSDSNPVKYFPN